MSAAARAGKPLHPTNLHVRRELYPRDTIQSRLPDPQWLERWLDAQICFDRSWEKKVSDMILLNLSKLLGVELRSAQDLARYRRGLARKAEALPA